MNTHQSQLLYARAKRLIPGGTQTISKRPEAFVPDEWPVYWSSASGCTVRDVDGNNYIDYVLGLGPIFLGYNDPTVTAAVRKQLDVGPLCTLQSPLEVLLAEKLVEHVPCAEMARFFKTGAEATSAAVRIARAATGREFIISAGYGGCHDWWVAKSADDKKRLGVPKCLSGLIADAPPGDVDTLEHLAGLHGEKVACIVVEAEAEPGHGAYLSAARRIADDIGAVLVLDEIVTGVRLGLSGAQALFNVTPDIATFGKALANGYPLAAVVGKRAVMEVAADLWLTSTYGGEALSLAAALAVIETIETTDAIDRTWRAGERLLTGLNAMGLDEDRVTVGGLAPCPYLRFSDADLDEHFVKQMFHRGFLTRRNHCQFVSAAHDDDMIDRTLEAAAQSLEHAMTVLE